MTTIKPFKDYDDDDPEIDRRKNRWNYWEALKKVRREYMSDILVLDGQFDAFDFEEYLIENYGLKMNIVNGNITDDYEIVDEKKYLIFILKYQ